MCTKLDSLKTQNRGSNPNTKNNISTKAPLGRENNDVESRKWQLAQINCLVLNFVILLPSFENNKFCIC